MGTLLDALYNDTKARVETLLNFANPDSLVTLSTDGWEAPGGIHIRNYVIVADNITFFHTATSNGTVRPTADNIAEETIAVMKDLHYLEMYFRFCSQLRDVAPIGQGIANMKKLQHLGMNIMGTASTADSIAEVEQVITNLTDLKLRSGQEPDFKFIGGGFTLDECL